VADANLHRENDAKRRGSASPDHLGRVHRSTSLEAQRLPRSPDDGNRPAFAGPLADSYTRLDEIAHRRRRPPRGDAERAVADLERAAVLTPQASEVQNHLGLAYGALGRDDDAVRAFERAVEIDCDNRAAQQNLRAAREMSQLTWEPRP
jgi:Flp pilus assembly protein TadD